MTRSSAQNPPFSWKTARAASTVALLMTAACASPYPDAPAVPTVVAAPPLPPETVFIPSAPVDTAALPPPGGRVRMNKDERIGATWQPLAGTDRIYPISIGVGDGQRVPPEQIAVELPQGEVFKALIAPNGNLWDVQSTFYGGARRPTYVVFLKPLHPDLGARTELIHIVTDAGRYQIRAHVYVGAGSAVTTLRLRAPERQAHSAIAPEALCRDARFTWDRALWWAPQRVCTLAQSDGGAETFIYLPRNVQSLPTVHAWTDEGPMVVNARPRADRSLAVDGTWPVLRLSGTAEAAGQHVDIYRSL